MEIVRVAMNFMKKDSQGAYKESEVKIQGMDNDYRWYEKTKPTKEERMHKEM